MPLIPNLYQDISKGYVPSVLLFLFMEAARVLTHATLHQILYGEHILGSDLHLSVQSLVQKRSVGLPERCLRARGTLAQ